MILSPIERSALELKIRQVFGAGVGTTALLAIIDAVNGGPLEHLPPTPTVEKTPAEVEEEFGYPAGALTPPVEAEVDEPHPVLERDVVVQEATP